MEQHIFIKIVFKHFYVSFPENKVLKAIILTRPSK